MVGHTEHCRMDVEKHAVIDTGQSLRYSWQPLVEVRQTFSLSTAGARIRDS